VEAASDKQAGDIVMLDTHEVCSFADYFVICSGQTRRQLEAIQDSIEQTLKQEGARYLHREGDVASGWLLLDFGSVIIHIFAPTQREYYQLDELWSKAPAVVRVQ
jgi:ribosome-associated protein